MNARHYHTPVTPTSSRVRCPVCREAVYSRVGIHPQCAVRLSEPPKAKPKPRGESGFASNPAEAQGAEVAVDSPATATATRSA